MNVELAIKVYNHITSFPENYTELIWGEQTEKGTTAGIAGYVVLFSGLGKIKNGSIEITEIDNVKQDWVKITQEELQIPFSVAFRMCVLCNEEQAKKAIGYIATGKLPNWKEIYQLHPQQW